MLRQFRNQPTDQFIDQPVACCAESRYRARCIGGSCFFGAIEVFLCDQFARIALNQTGAKTDRDMAVGGGVEQLHELFEFDMQHIIRFGRTEIFRDLFMGIGHDAIPDLLGE